MEVNRWKHEVVVGVLFLLLCGALLLDGGEKEYRESWTAISKVVGVRVEWEVLQGQHGTPEKPRDNDGEQFPGWIFEPHVGDVVVGSTRTRYKVVSREHRWSANAQDRAVMVVRLEVED